MSNLSLLSLGRSHRSKLGKSRLKFAIDETRRILGIPESYLVGIVPASDTGAYEMAMWNMLGARDIDVCHWESFGKGWYTDAVSHLKLREQGVDVREHTADYGSLPDLTLTSPDRDVLFTYNGTTSGVRVPDGCLLLQAGMQLEYLTAGTIEAGMHEVLATPEALERVAASRGGGGAGAGGGEEGGARRPASAWRVSSTVFGHVASDRVLRPLAPFDVDADAAPGAAEEKWPPVLAGDFVSRELEAIALKRE